MKSFNKHTWLALAVLSLSAPAGTYAAETADNRVIGINDQVYNLPGIEADALEFLYQAMPMSDRIMYKPEYHLRNVRLAIQAREEMPWGKNVPEDIWKHFVLPARSNNEYLDNFRARYYAELKARVSGMSMKDAALEVNHWLHEKVTYQPSDARTSSPEASIKTAKGRCGEESVLGVAAFRTVGIPARQVYTPRWAHTDDNHAWVEVWVDGKWYFLGACEPEPELNRAWFNAPASRGMLMHTRVFGDYKGPEQIMSVNNGITEINVTENYVPVRKSTVTVVNRAGKPVKDIKVQYKIYNYAEFYTAATRTTDKNGSATLLTGKGDLLAWATDGKYFGFAKVDSPNTKLILSHKIGEVFETDIEIIPPAENPIPTHATQEQIEENAKRFELENDVRTAYENTFFGGKFCNTDKNSIAERFGEQRCEKICTLLEMAKGNWYEIFDFLNGVPSERLDEAIAMLYAVSQKDLRDTPAYIFNATLYSTQPQTDNPLYVDYILNPRVSNELLSDYRKTMHHAGKSQSMTADQIFEYTQKNIRIDNASNAYRVPVTPTYVWKSGEADEHSRDIFFVAACRNNNIPARLDPVTGQCQYNENGKWITVDFNQSKRDVKPEGRIKATYIPTEYLSDPGYYRHFTISAVDNGSPQLFEFGEDMGESYSSLLAEGTPLPTGYYLLTSGIRQASGTVNVHLSFFNIEKERTTTVPLTINHKAEAIEVIGSINPEILYMPDGKNTAQSVLSTTGRGYFILGILGDTDEQSNHAVKELESLGTVLEKWGRSTLIIGKKRPELNKLPNLYWGTDIDNGIRQMLEQAVQRQNVAEQRLPVIVLADSFGRVVFLTEGYDTSLAQKLTGIIPEL